MTGEDGKSGAFKIGFDGKAPLGVAGAKLIFNAESQDFSMLAGRYKVIQWPVSGVDLFMEHGRVFTTAKFLFNYERTRSGVVMISVNDLSDRSYRFFHGQCTSTLFHASSEPIGGGQP